MTPDEGLAFWATTPLAVVPIRIELGVLGGYQFDWVNGSQNPAILIAGSEADITPDHILIDGGRAYFDHFGRPAAWTDIAGRSMALVPRQDTYGEAFGTACAGIWGPNAPVPPNGVFFSAAARDEVKAFILSLNVSPSPTTGPVPATPTPPAPASPFNPVEQHGPLPAANFMVGRNHQPIDRIVLHTMVSWIGAADAHFHADHANVSAHFGVRIDGSLWQWVNLWDAAYHAGNLDVNLRSIGIEHEDEGDPAIVRPDALYARSAALVAQFCREYGIPLRRGWGGPGIYDHRQITATGCPDGLDTDRIICEARKL